MRKPKPLPVNSGRPRCPVCNEVTYSRAGVHPQCAQVQADARRVARLKSSKRAAAKVVTPPEGRSWHRPCPRCHAQVHVRKSICACGYMFPGGAAARASAAKR